MSIQFSDTTTRKGLVQLYERTIGLDFGTVSEDEGRLQEFTADANVARDTYTTLAARGSGTWQHDDSGHGDMPIIQANLVSGQSIYPLLTDENGNAILDIYKVFVRNPQGIYVPIDPVDQQTQQGTQGFWDGRNTSGTPLRYDKTGNTIILDPIPNYNWRQTEEGQRGLKALINRESYYFVYTDTTRKPGVPGVHHEYFYLKPAYEEAFRKSLDILPALQKRIDQWEGNESLGIKGKIETYFAERARDERRVIRVKEEDNE